MLFTTSQHSKIHSSESRSVIQPESRQAVAAAGGKILENQNRTQLLQSNLERQQNQVYYIKLSFFRIEKILNRLFFQRLEGINLYVEIILVSGR